MRFRANFIIFLTWSVSLLGNACTEKEKKPFPQRHKKNVKNEVCHRSTQTANSLIAKEFNADIPYGRIGFKKGDPDRAYDNLFHVVVSRMPLQYEIVYLEYELNGVADHGSVCRSINDSYATGGDFIRFGHNWAGQQDPVSKISLHKGDNVIRFSIPENARYAYEVRHVRLVYKADKHDSPVIVDQLKTIYKGQFLLKLVVNDKGALYCNDQQVDLRNGEGKVLMPSGPVKLFFRRINGKTWSKRFLPTGLKIADTAFTETTPAKAFADLYRVRKGVSLQVKNDGAGIFVPALALAIEKQISINLLRGRDIAPLQPDMVNVTASSEAYRFLPHGTHFNKSVHIRLPIDTTRLPEGYTKADIRIFYFDENQREWVALPPDTALLAQNMVGALSTHFTDMIAGIIKVPESPQTQGYTPTSIKDYKAADPSAEIPMIAAPVANTVGNASLTFPIKIPKGRNGLQPNLNLNYNSDGGNGWLGLGWNLATSFIGVDTRWGVPRYDTSKETETYLLNGEQLAPLANRTAFVPRANERQFNKRIEGDFQKITRHGDNPANYWWQVTDKHGVSSYYGGTPDQGVINGAVLKDASGHIAQWMLVEVRDLHDNYIGYIYAHTSRTAVSGGQLQGTQIYLSTINYTGTGQTPGKYSVRFLRDSVSRKDIEVSARMGVLTVSADLLREIDIYDQNGQPFRFYKLNYSPGAFNKSLLRQVQELDDQRLPFYSYGFHYFNEVATAGRQLLATENWSPPADAIRGDFPDLLPGFTDESSALSTSKTRSNGAGLTLTIGVSPGFIPFPNKDFTLGGNVAHDNGQSDGLVTMIDINGDGLPDKVFKKNGAIFYRPNLALVGQRFGDIHPVTGINSISTGSSSTNKSSVQVYPFGAFFGHETSTTRQTTDTYFADFNGDGLMDISIGGQVFFNHINANGDPVFSATSTGTPNPILPGSLDRSFLAPDTALQHEQEQQYPLEDAVRFWQAPFAGTVNVSGNARLLPPNAGTLPPKDDGVKLSIESRGAAIWSTNIAAGDFTAKTPTGVTNLSVAAGQRIFFRVHSVYNGNDDQVQWDPLISYQGMIRPDTDANKRASNRYKASEDFILDNQNGATMPKSGVVAVSGIFTKAPTSDTVTLVVKQVTSGVSKSVFSKKFGPESLVNGQLTFPAFAVSAQDILVFAIQTDSYIDRTALSWTPHYIYSAFTDGTPTVDLTAKPILDGFVVPDNSNYNDWRMQGAVYTAPKTGLIRILPNITSAADSGLAAFTVKGPDTIYAKRWLSFNHGVITGNTDTIRLNIKAGQHYYFDFAIANRAAAIATSHTATQVFRDSLSNDPVPVHITKIDQVTAGLYSNPDSRTFGSLFRGWGQFQYKGDMGNVPIDETKLTLNQWSAYPTDPTAYTDTNTIKNLPNPVLADVAPMTANAVKNQWSGLDSSAFVSAMTVSSSRLYLHDVSVDSLMQGTGLTAVSKIRKSKASSTWAGIGTGIATDPSNQGPLSANLSGSSSSSSETTLLDMIDMNGDHYPDVLNENNIQYTFPSGNLEATARSAHNLGGASGSGTSKTGGLGGSFSPAKSNNSTQGNAYQVVMDASMSIGLSGNVATSDQRSTNVWVDVNGDGLPDKLYNNGLVALNLGYAFAPAENWNIAAIDKNHGTSVSGGGNGGIGSGINGAPGTNLFQGSFEAGFGLTRSTGTGSYMLADMNGDGLIDQVYTDGVQLNNGNSFDAKTPWSTLTHFNDNVSTGESLNAAFTIVIPLDFIFETLKICINPSVNTGWGLSREQYQIMDIDGDGYPDLLHSENDGDLQVNRSTIGKTNLLAQVDRPLHSSLSIDYARAGNTYAMPENKWVMHSATLLDSIGRNGANVMSYRFDYQDGYYDRQEREFLGFKTVTTSDLNTQANYAVYRSTVQQFQNQNYYTKGLLETNYLEDASGNKYTQTNDVYQLRQVANNVFFPALRQTIRQYFEGQSNNPAQTSIYYDYDSFGNVTLIDDIGDGTSADEVTASINYFSFNIPYLQAIPKTIIVKNQGAVVRQRTQQINSNFGDITRISQFLSNGTTSDYDMEYDSYGNISKIFRPTNYKNDRLWYSYTYDGTVHSYVTRVDDAYGYFSTSLYDLRFGLVLRDSSITKEPMSFSYDNRGRVIKLTGPYELAAKIDHTIQFDYHPEASVPFALTSHYDPAHPENEQGIRIIHFMDGFGRTIQVKKDIALFVSKTQDKDAMTVSGRVVYDAFGRIVKNYYPVTENINVSLNQQFNSAIGNLNDTTSFDVEDRPLTNTLADRSITKYAYSLNAGRLQTSVTDALNHVRETVTDVRGRKREDHALSGPLGPIVTKFSYDGLNELVKVEDAGANISTFNYDNLGRKISATHPDAGTTTFVYDPAGNLIQKITPQINKLIPETGAINYAYDHERITGIDYPIQYQNKVTYQYGDPKSGDRAGRVILQEDASGGREFFYGKLGEVTKEIRTVMVSSIFYTTYVSQQSYDTWNRLRSMTYPDGETLTYKYNNGGTLASITGVKFGDSIHYVNRVGYDEYEQRVYLKYGNGAENNYTYDPQRRRLTTLTGITASGRQMMNNSYTYDPVSNIMNITNSAKPVASQLGGSARYDYSYDGLYRLTSAKGAYRGFKDSAGYSLAMDYDNLYNITSKKMTDQRPANSYAQTYSYGTAGPHQPTKIGADDYAYDLDGNVTKAGDITKNGRSSFWDEEDRLMAVIKNNVLSEYTYDADGERVVKSSGGVQGIWVNNAPAGTINHRNDYTVYVSPYLVCSRTGFTKHFYIEGQRIATQIGKGKFTNISFPQSALSAGGINYLNRAMELEQQRIAYYASIKGGIQPGPPTNKLFYAEPQNSQIAAPILVDNTSASPPGWPSNTTPPTTGPPIFVAPIPSRDSVNAGYGYTSIDKTEELERYFYHPDHLGSTNYVTGVDGEVAQHFEYSAFGETLMDEHNGTLITAYRFNAKEKDDETGLYYYGARYYDPKVSNWLAVDPMQDKYAGLSPYNFTLNNPVRLVDPSGKDVNKHGFDENFTPILDLEKDVAANAKSAYNETASTAITTGLAAQQWTINHKEVLLTVAKGMQEKGSKAVAAGAVMAIVGAPEGGIPALPGIALAAAGAAESDAGTLLEFGVEFITDEDKKAGVTVSNYFLNKGLEKIGEIIIGRKLPVAPQLRKILNSLILQFIESPKDQAVDKYKENLDK